MNSMAFAPFVGEPEAAGGAPCTHQSEGKEREGQSSRVVLLQPTWKGEMWTGDQLVLFRTKAFLFPAQRLVSTEQAVQAVVCLSREQRRSFRSDNVSLSPDAAVVWFYRVDLTSKHVFTFTHCRAQAFSS